MRRAALAAVVLAAVAAAGLGAVLLRGPGEGPADPDRFRSAVGEVPAVPQRAGDAAAGREALLNAPYVGCGMPRAAWRRIAPETAPQDRLPGRTGPNAELPYFLTSHVDANGVELVVSNCLTCHAGRLDGEVVVGLGDAFRDFTGDARGLVTQVGRYVQGPAETAAWERWADRIEGIAPHIRTGTVGSNPATNLSWALMAHRDPRTMEWSAEPLIEPPPEVPVPLRVPPWWWMKKKNAMFYTTIGRGDHSRYMLFASLLCADSLEELEEVDAYAADIRAYLETIEPPAFPRPVDAALAAEGKVLFEQGCAACHGTYGETPTYPNRVVPLAAVGTDPLYAQTATDGGLDRFYDWVDRSPHGGTVRAAPAPGYIAPPLDGIWAVAPYLHNGSVPTLRALLDPRARPEFWRHVLPRDYDYEALGWRYEALPAGKEAAEDPEARARVYDTTLPGYDNGGHLFGSDLDAAGRAALLEYLKTL